jgi:hypothetical protein
MCFLFLNPLGGVFFRETKKKKSTRDLEPHARMFELGPTKRYFIFLTSRNPPSARKKFKTHTKEK